LVLFVPASQAWLCIIPKEGALCKKGAHLCRDEMRDAFPSVIWSSFINPAMDCARDERISESNRSSPHCDAKSKMGTGSDRAAGFAKCVSECNFHCRNVRVYRGGRSAWPDFR
jgi:hypothetical protein